MAYNLRPRLLREELLETLYDENDEGGEASASEEDEVADLEHDSETEEEEDGVETDASDAEQDDELADDMQDARPTKRMRQREEEQNELDETPLSERLQHSRRSRGRPQSKLYGKSVKGSKRFVWSTNAPTRQSGKFLCSMISERGKVYNITINIRRLPK